MCIRDSANTAHSFMSFFFRTEYNYKDLYYAEVAARTDASDVYKRQQNEVSYVVLMTIA